MKNIESQIPPKIQQLLHAAISPGRLNPRKHFDSDKDAEMIQNFRERGFNPEISHLIVREIPQELRVEIDDPMIELKGGAEHPFRIERKCADGTWELLQRCATEDDAANALPTWARFELVVGERRWRAAGALEMTYVPAVVVQYDDRKVLEVMLVENLQRDDLRPMEEAAGFAELLALKNPETGKLVHTVKSVAEKIGRTATHVQNRLDLLQLRDSRAAEALESGKLNVSAARLIARLPTAELRDEVTEKVLNNPLGPSPMQYPQISQMIQDEYQKELRGARFALADADLLPIVKDDAGQRIKGGACNDCPFNSKNIPDSPGRFQMCLNPNCYRDKEFAEFEAWRVGVTNETGRRIGLSYEANEELWDFTGKQLVPSSLYFDQGNRPPEHELHPEAGDVGTWKQLLKGSEITVYLGRDRDGKTRELVRRDEAVMAATRAGHDIFRRSDRAKSSKSTAEENDQALAAAKKAAGRKAEIYAAELGAILESVHATKTLPDEAWPLAVSPLLATLEEIEEIAAVASRHGWNPPKPADLNENTSARGFLTKFFKKMPAPHRFGFLIELCISTMPLGEDGVKRWGKAMKLDLKGVRKGLETRFAAADAAEAERSEIEGGLVWNTQREKADDFEWNGMNICEKPDVCALALPKTKAAKLAASVSVARSAKGWHYGLDVKLISGGYSWGPSQIGTAYDSRRLALAMAIQEILRDPGFAKQYEPAARERLEAYLELLRASGAVVHASAPASGKSKLGKLAAGESAPGKSGMTKTEPLSAMGEQILEVLREGDLEGRTIQEIGSKIGKTPQTVSVWLNTTGKKFGTIKSIGGKWYNTADPDKKPISKAKKK